MATKRVKPFPKPKRKVNLAAISPTVHPNPNLAKFTPLTPEQTEIVRLKTLNEDMDHQIRDLLSRRAFTKEQYTDIERRLKEHGELVKETGMVIAFLRNQYPSDFALGGPHKDRAFSQIVLSYLRGLL